MLFVFHLSSWSYVCSTVVLQCYRWQWSKAKFDPPYNFVLSGPIITILGVIDYVGDPYSYANFGWIWLGGEFPVPANRWNIIPLTLWLSERYYPPLGRPLGLRGSWRGPCSRRLRRQSLDAATVVVRITQVMSHSEMTEMDLPSLQLQWDCPCLSQKG